MILEMELIWVQGVEEGVKQADHIHMLEYFKNKEYNCRSNYIVDNISPRFFLS